MHNLIAKGLSSFDKYAKYSKICAIIYTNYTSDNRENALCIKKLAKLNDNKKIQIIKLILTPFWDKRKKVGTKNTQNSVYNKLIHDANYAKKFLNMSCIIEYVRFSYGKKGK